MNNNNNNNNNKGGGGRGEDEEEKLLKSNRVVGDSSSSSNGSSSSSNDHVDIDDDSSSEDGEEKPLLSLEDENNIITTTDSQTPIYVYDEEDSYDIRSSASHLDSSINANILDHKKNHSSKLLLFQIYSTVLAILYLSTSAVLPLLSKQIFINYDYPLTSSLLQTVGASILLLVFNIIQYYHNKGDLLPKSYITDHNFLSKAILMLPVSICFAIVISLTNIGISMVPVNFHIIFKSTNIIWVVIFSFIVHREKPTISILISIAFLMGGTIMVSLVFSGQQESSFCAEGSLVILLPLLAIEHVKGFSTLVQLPYTTILLVIAGIFVTIVFQATTVGLIKSLYVITVGTVTQLQIIPQILLSVTSVKDHPTNMQQSDNTPLSLLPWVIQSEIIYIVCNYRRNRGQREIKLSDVYHVAGVSRKWRNASKVSLTLCQRFIFGQEDLEVYRRRHSDNSLSSALSLLSGPHHTIDVDLSKHSPIFQTHFNFQYAQTNLDWFIDTIINKMPYFNFIDVHKDIVCRWVSLIKGHGKILALPSLKKLSFGRIDVNWPLFLFHHLQELDIDIGPYTTTEICSFLNHCHTLKSLIIDNSNDNKIDIDKVFSSIPRTLTKLSWSVHDKDNQVSDNPNTNPLPFHLLPSTIRHLLIWSIYQSSTREYYDFVLANSVHTIVHYSQDTYLYSDQSTHECINFLVSSPSSPIKHIYHIVTSNNPTTTTTTTITENETIVVVPPLLEELELWILKGESVYEIFECLFRQANVGGQGPLLPNLHTLTIKCMNQGSEHFPYHLGAFIRSSQSLAIIDIEVPFFYNKSTRFDSIKRFLDSVANSHSVELVYIRFVQGPTLPKFDNFDKKNFVGRLKQLLQDFKNNSLELHYKDNLITINNK
ncbi:hypothetical protein DFA_07869 [Cavenderia fasciculata]|uniref:Sugar phosphate transporter domain-containing protein n=1 Tax=Cavenderia fasciculata TaxID=261658 RepID=F4Q3S2_CACFS|nr:uncharacterized protein DFA_07869 [Cavenderia fasciculata]EGG16888.1 hypothetical protein DFA_07869 [Cavenderia fasciculata]|eukprot:XP_004355362.1 hypothetical protein DFA_07869 [Cavenderia fasciculata]